ncbi:MerR family transcriptional regulator [Flavobacterium pallidum]|uniref:MerR family transcriptional regulator n=1 Tax=Flavobacterium pallidum TaxID=2172098 RepID=A0A2S1SHJ1_9FLAO|nr:MerR family transcriptional regulator [Flavobacterium pallidum]AWI25817.1 MerR family transcriptional regulator [Flavobacterium pallidum]
MNNTHAIFNIRDLENISGIKAHTIRIWEKRYNILQPERTDTNIRLYTIENLRRLLNITLLHHHGYKISKIAIFDEGRLASMIKDIISPKTVKHHAINAFKMAMLQFDQQFFQETYFNLLAEKSFREIFNDIFIPLLNEVGLLWQTETITAVQEHFISSMIRQKLFVSIEKTQQEVTISNSGTFIFYLPSNENHDIGLLYMYYEAILNGYKTIYLGPGIQIDDLRRLLPHVENPVFVTYFTLHPEKETLQEYFSEFLRKLPDETELWIAGHKVLDLPDQVNIPSISIIRSFADYTRKL